jgi:hypothetical protein
VVSSRHRGRAQSPAFWRDIVHFRVVTRERPSTTDPYVGGPNPSGSSQLHALPVDASVMRACSLDSTRFGHFAIITCDFVTVTAACRFACIARCSVASVRTVAEGDEDTRDRTIDSYVVADDIDGLQAVLEKVILFLNETSEDGRSFTWTPWLSAVFVRRVAGIPLRIGIRETAAWSDLALHAGDQTVVALAALRGVSAPLSSESISVRLDEEADLGHDGRASAIASNITERVRATAEMDDQTFSTLQEFVQTLRKHISGDELKTIVESAMHAGRPEAVAWLAN